MCVVDGGVYIDLTLGRSGHAKEIASQMGSNGRLVGFDRDQQAIEFGREIFKDDPRVTIVHSDFQKFSQFMEQLGIDKVDGVLLDLGVSSPQLDQADRGFSFMRQGDLDMRMDRSSGETAAQWLARVDEADLVQVLFDYGEEKFARRIARAIVETRQQQSIETNLWIGLLLPQMEPFCCIQSKGWCISKHISLRFI